MESYSNNQTPSIQSGWWGLTGYFFQKLGQYPQTDNSDKCNKLQNYFRMIVNEVNKFDEGQIYDYNQIEIMTNDIQMGGIVLLHILSPNTILSYNNSLTLALSRIVPNLRELDRSITFMINIYFTLREFSKFCPRLEKITFHRNALLRLYGHDMLSADNLKEIYMDHSTFKFYTYFIQNGPPTEYERISNLNDYPNTFLLSKYSKRLERVSIWDANYYNFTTTDMVATRSQNFLIKLISKAPTMLHWFRSDLTKENISMLQQERPGIQFLR